MPYKANKQRKPKRQAYVLMIVLAASILVITTLSTLAKISLRRAVAAVDAERSLQKRWGSMTLERAILKQAPTIFEKRLEQHRQLSPELPPPIPMIRDAVTIHGITYDVLLGDEDAKVNLNSVFHQVGATQTQATIGQLTDGAAAGSIALQPATTPQAIRDRDTERSGDEAEIEEPGFPDAFRSWGEVFDASKLESIIGADVALPNVTTRISCWGSGRLNLSRAADDSIISVASVIIREAEAEKMVQRYRENPTIDIQTLLRTEIQDERDRERLGKLIGNDSNHFSVWISASSKTGRADLTFTVSLQDDEGTIQIKKFSF